MSPEPLLTVAEVAERLNLSTTAVYDLCNAGLLPCYRLGTGKKKPPIRIRPEALEEYLRSCQVKPAPAAAALKVIPAARSRKVVGLDFIRSQGAKV